MGKTFFYSIVLRSTTTATAAAAATGWIVAVKCIKGGMGSEMREYDPKKNCVYGIMMTIYFNLKEK